MLRGDIVKDNSGAYAVLTEQGSSASRMTAAKTETVLGQSTDLLKLCSTIVSSAVLRLLAQSKRLRLAETKRRTKIDSQTVRMVSRNDRRAEGDSQETH